MKIREFILLVVLAALLSKAIPDQWMASDHGFPFAPLVAHAQQPGFGGWQNIHMYRVPADASDSATGGTGLQDVSPPFAFNIPASPGNATLVWYDCQLAYSQATAAVVDGFGLAFSVSPTSSQNFLIVEQAAATAPITSTPVSITNTTATAFAPTFTPGATATAYMARAYGLVEEPAGNQDNVVFVRMQQATQGDVLTLKKNSVCMVHSVN